jgi:5-oxoprolinase (ATP-hydrolysing) subunit A
LVEMSPIDLNSDVGEGYGAWPGGPDDELLAVVTSANVACGFHAGDPSIIRRTCAQAAAQGVVVGAQVAYPDLAGFGRRFIDIEPGELADAVVYQLAALSGIATVEGTAVRYVKPHGALYNAVVHHGAQAAAVGAAISAFDAGLAWLGLPGSVAASVAEDAGLCFVAEGFADRGYTAEGTLVPRGHSGALITEPPVAAAGAVRLACAGVRSICVHSDTPGAPAIAAAVRAALFAAGFELRPFAR